jgi:hypothetical protein
MPRPVEPGVSPTRRSRARERAPLGSTLLGACLALAAACDGGARAPDARGARASAESAEVSVRFDVSPDKSTSVHVLAFRASVSSAPAQSPLDVLGTVDPLAADAPEQGCVVRDVDVLTSALGARGASIELEEMSGIGVGLDGAATLLRPFPRLYPDVAAVLGGVVAEVGPQSLAALPDRVSLYTSDVELPVAELALPAAPRITTVDGAAPAPGLRVDTGEALAVGVAGSGGVVELRPFGATVAVACAVPAGSAPETTVSIPRPLLARVLGASAPGPAGTVAASLEVARRSRLRQALGAAATRISVEVRAATTVELRP